jgi:hypothetical protein
VSAVIPAPIIVTLDFVISSSLESLLLAISPDGCRFNSDHCPDWALSEQIS